MSHTVGGLLSREEGFRIHLQESTEKENDIYKKTKFFKFVISLWPSYLIVLSVREVSYSIPDFLIQISSLQHYKQPSFPSLKRNILCW